MRATFIFAILIVPLVATSLSTVSASPLNARRHNRRQEVSNRISGSSTGGKSDVGYSIRQKRQSAGGNGQYGNGYSENASAAGNAANSGGYGNGSGAGGAAATAAAASAAAAAAAGGAGGYGGYGSGSGAGGATTAAAAAAGGYGGYYGNFRGGSADAADASGGLVKDVTNAVREITGSIGI